MNSSFLYLTLLDLVNWHEPHEGFPINYPNSLTLMCESLGESHIVLMRATE